MQFVFHSVWLEGKWMDLSGRYIFSWRSAVALCYHRGKVKSHCHSFHLLSKLAMQIYVNSCHSVWLLIGQSSLQSTLRVQIWIYMVWQEEERRRKRGTALCQLTSWSWHSAEIRKMSTRSDEKTYRQHKLWGNAVERWRINQGQPKIFQMFFFLFHFHKK